MAPSKMMLLDETIGLVPPTATVRVELGISAPFFLTQMYILWLPVVLPVVAEKFKK